MKKCRIRHKFLEELKKLPIVEQVCLKLGVSRNTYYRWRKEDLVFSGLADDAQSQGEDVVNDYAESNVIQGIQNKDRKYTEYWLSHRHMKYQRRHIKKKQLSESVKYDPAKRAEFLKKWFMSDGSPVKVDDTKKDIIT